MIWIISCDLIHDAPMLIARHQFIEEVSQTHVSPWQKHTAKSEGVIKPAVDYYQCRSEKGEYGFVITAHINELPTLLQTICSHKTALFFINTCLISDAVKARLMTIVKKRNPQSELFLARQERHFTGNYINYVDDVGTFGFPTTESERELFMKRHMGLTKALRLAFEKAVRT